MVGFLAVPHKEPVRFLVLTRMLELVLCVISCIISVYDINFYINIKRDAVTYFAGLDHIY